jgi:hypothetical protein
MSHRNEKIYPALAIITIALVIVGVLEPIAGLMFFVGFILGLFVGVLTDIKTLK